MLRPLWGSEDVEIASSKKRHAAPMSLASDRARTPRPKPYQTRPLRRLANACGSNGDVSGKIRV